MKLNNINIDQIKGYMKIKGYSERTKEEYMRIINRYIKHCEIHAVKELGQIHIMQGFQQLNPYRMTYFALRIILISHSRKDELDKLVVPKNRRRQIPPHISQEEFNIYLRFLRSEYLNQKNSNPELYLLVWLIFETGLRINTCLDLRVANIDFKDKIIRGITKGDKKFSIPLRNDFIDELKRFINLRSLNKENKLFTRKYDTYLKIMRKTGLKVLGIKLRPHLLRDSFAFNLERKGVPITVIQKLLGHSRIDTTSIYLEKKPQEVIDIFRMKMGD